MPPHLVQRIEAPHRGLGAVDRRLAGLAAHLGYSLGDRAGEGVERAVVIRRPSALRSAQTHNTDCYAAF